MSRRAAHVLPLLLVACVATTTACAASEPATESTPAEVLTSASTCDRLGGLSWDGIVETTERVQEELGVSVESIDAVHQYCTDNPSASLADAVLDQIEGNGGVSGVPPADAESWCQSILENSGLDEYLSSISGTPIQFEKAVINETSDLRLIKCNTQGDSAFAVSIIEWKSESVAAASLESERARWVTMTMLPVTLGDIEGGMSYDAVTSGTYVQYSGIPNATTLIGVGSDFRGYSVPEDGFASGIDGVVRAVMATPLPANL